MMIFGGDMIFGDQPVLFGFGFDSEWKKVGYKGIFDGISSELEKADHVIANFESIIRPRNEAYGINDWAMCCDERIVNVLKQHHVSIVTVANNHICDFGVEYYQYTVDCLEQAGIQVIGTKQKPYAIIEDEDKRIVIVSASYVGRYQKEQSPILFQLESNEWKAICEECKHCDMIVAYVHWGNEYITKPTQDQMNLANMMVEAGVDLIIGHHPHILQEHYEVSGKPVFFSMGNLFSDYWQPRLRKTYLLKVEAKTQSYHQIPCMIDEHGCPRITSVQDQPVSFTSNHQISTKEDIARERSVVRKETIQKIIRNCYRYRHKLKFVKWVLGRVIYIIKYGKKEKTNPNIIYEQYKQN